MQNTDEPLSVTIEEARRLSDLGPTTIFALLRAGRLRRIKIGKRTLIGFESLKALLGTSENVRVV